MNLIELSRFNWLVVRNKEQLLGQYKERLDSYDEGIQQHIKFKQLGENTASIIHDLANPAQVISCELELLKMHAHKLNDPVLNKELSRAQSANTRLIDLLKQSKQERLSKSTHKKVSLKRVIANALEFVHHRVEKHDICLTVTGQSDAEVTGDSVKLSQVMVNLLNNACDEVVEHKEPWIEIKMVHGAGKVLLSISNSEDKIPDELQQKIMTPFFTTKSDTGGSGMGLHICKRHLNEMGADIAISQHSKHTQFDLIFDATAASLPQS